MPLNELTDRQRREAAYYDQYAQLHRVERVDFAPVRSETRRPWSPYWQLCSLVRDQYRDPTQRLLDFGCGPGVASVTFADLGFQTCGFDVAPGNVAAAYRLAERHGFSDRCRFDVMPAEKLDYPDAHFDVVVGIDILHHVDIPRAIKEVRRVLKPGGVALFKEPIEAPVLERVRMSRLVNSLAPRQVSFEKRLHTTEDERKLGPADVAAIAKELHIERTYRFSLLNRLSRFAPSQYARLMWLDYQAFRLVPPLGLLGDVRIWQCRK